MEFWIARINKGSGINTGQTRWLELRSRQSNLQIYWIQEETESKSDLVTVFVDKWLKEEISIDSDLQIQRARVEHKKLKKFGETQTQETLLIAHMRRKWGVAILIASAENFELLKEIKDKKGRTDENVLKP